MVKDDLTKPNSWKSVLLKSLDGSSALPTKRRSPTGDTDTQGCYIESSDDNQCETIAGNPIACNRGAKVENFTLLDNIGSRNLSVGVSYSSLNEDKNPLTNADTSSSAGNWQISDLYTLEPYADGSTVRIHTPDHRIYMFFAPGASLIMAPGDYVVNASWTAERQEKGWINRLPGGWLWTLGDGTQYTFDINGNMTKVIFVGGHQQLWFWQTSGNTQRPARVADEFGNGANLLFDDAGQLQSVIDDRGRVTTLSYNLTNTLSTVTLPDGAEEYYYYDAYYKDSSIFASFPYALTYQYGLKTGGPYGYDQYGRASSTQTLNGSGELNVHYEDTTHIQVQEKLNAVDLMTTNFTYSAMPKKFGVVRKDWQPCLTCVWQSEIYGYDSNGYLNSVLNSQGVMTTYNKDSRGRTEQIVNGSNGSNPIYKNIILNQNWNLPQQERSGQLQVDYLYDPVGHLLSKTKTDLATNETRTTSYTYNQQGLVDSINGPRTDVADITHINYDAKGYIQSATDPLGNTKSIASRDPITGLPSEIRDINGISIFTAYNPRGYVMQTGRVNAQTSYLYQGNVVSSIIPPGIQPTVFIYDTKYNLIKTKQNGGEADITRDMEGREIGQTSVDDSGNFLRYRTQSFDGQGNLTSITHYDGTGNENFTYDALGNQIQSLRNGITKKNFFNSLNQLSQSVDGMRNSTAYKYDDQGRLSSITDAKNHVTSYNYNAFGDLLNESNQNTGKVSYTYDTAGNRISEINARNVTTLTTYDALNRPLTISRSIPQDDGAADTLMGAAGYNGNWIYTYDTKPPGETSAAIGRLSRIQGNGIDIWMSYDADGRLLSQSRTIGTATLVTRWEYYLNGDVSAIIYPSGRRVNYQRDNWGRVVKVDTVTPGDTPTTVVQNIKYENIPGGRRINTPYFDPLVQVSNISLSPLGLDISRSYNLEGRLVTQMPSPYGLNATSASYNYDASSRLSSIQSSGLGVVSHQYVYDADDRLINYVGSAGNQKFSYDEVGNRVTDVTQKPDVTYTQNVALLAAQNQQSTPISFSYTYDHFNQHLLNDGRRSYSYDAAGNALQAGDVGFHYEGDNRPWLVVVSPSNDTNNSVVPSTTNPFDSVTTTAARTGATTVMLQDFGPEGHRERKVSASHETIYSYDPVAGGLLLSEASQTTDTATPTTDPWLTTAANAARQVVNTQGKVIDPLLGSGMANNLGNTIEYAMLEAAWKATPDLREYIWLDGELISVVQPIIQGGTREVYAVQTDHLGTPIALYNHEGVALVQRLISPFGQIRNAADWFDSAQYTKSTMTGSINISTSTPTPLIVNTVNMDIPVRFPGQTADPETGLYQNWHRDYDPVIGRYVQSDPVGLVGGLNFYLYSQANPIEFYDAEGTTQHDIDYARVYLAKLTPGMAQPIEVRTANLGGPRGFTPFSAWFLQSYIEVDKKYLACLGSDQAKALLETMVHETIHLNQNFFVNRIDAAREFITKTLSGEPDSAAQDEAFDITVQRNYALVDEFDKTRKIGETDCACNKN